MITLHRAKTITGWMSDAELTFLAETAAKSNIVFEIGSYQGRSTRVLGDNVDGLVFAIDSWNSKDSECITDYCTFNIFYCNMIDLINNGRVIPERSTWQDYKPCCGADFIFIDGNHRYEIVKNDIYKALRWVKPEGIIAGHDYTAEWPSVINAVNELFSGHKVNLVDTIWWIQL